VLQYFKIYIQDVKENETTISVVISRQVSMWKSLHPWNGSKW